MTQVKIFDTMPYMDQGIAKTSFCLFLLWQT